MSNDGFANLFGPSKQQQKEMLMQAYAAKQFEDHLLSVARMTEVCFRECAHNFRLRKLDDKEELCVNRCAAKFLRLAARSEALFLESIGGGALAALDGD
jgi:mitochondrial import inner membrane translocase subunit TIM9